MYLDYFTNFLYVFASVMTMYLLIKNRAFFVKHKSALIIFFMAILMISQYQRYFDKLFTPGFNYNFESLPIHFCRMSALMSLVYFITRNKYVAGFVFFQSGLGFLSIIVPGGHFLTLSENYRDLPYIYDHYLLSIMPVLLVFIMGYVPNKKDMYLSMIYSVVVPMALLPYALATGTNAYYVLDGVLIKAVFGSNQFVISTVFIILITFYNYIMFVIGSRLAKAAQKEPVERPFFKPIWPFVAITSYIIIGITVGIFFIRSVPDYLLDNTTSYDRNPASYFDEWALKYNAVMDGKEVSFIEIINDKKFDEVSVFDINGNELLVSEIDGVFYYDRNLATTDKIIVVLYGNRGEDNQKTRVYQTGK